MEEWFSEYDADADYDVGRGLSCLYWVILRIIKLQQTCLANIYNAGKYISLQIFLPGSTVAGWLADLWDIFQFKAMGILKCYICYFVIFSTVWNLSNEDIFLLILRKCQLFCGSRAVLLSV